VYTHEPEKPIIIAKIVARTVIHRYCNYKVIKTTDKIL